MPEVSLRTLGPYIGSTSIKLLSIKLLSQRNPPNGTFPKNTYPKAPTTKRHPGQVNTLAVTFLTYNDQKGSYLNTITDFSTAARDFA